MTKRIWKRIAWITVGLVLLAMIVLAFIPKPIPVETAAAAANDLRVVVEAEGETRVIDRYIIAAPVTGRLGRVDLEPGDPIEGGATISTIAPPELDPMQRAELEARIGAAEAYLRQAGAGVERVRVELEQAERERDRLQQLLGVGSVAERDVELARKAVDATRQELESAKFRARAAASELDVARSGRIAVDGGGRRTITLTAPVGGRILRVFEKDSRVVPAGTPVVSIGDPTRLEVVIDVLSSDAVNIVPGAAVEIVGWGGDQPIAARVKLVEPSAFTKVSVLGIDEQRVNVIAELTGSQASLGDGFRVDARIVTWQGKGVLSIPTSALFRYQGAWCVFVVDAGIARRRPVEIGHRSSFEVEVMKGLAAGDIVISHPSDKIEDGTPVEPAEGT